MTGYFLNGVDGDHILVFRTEDSEDLFKIIQRLRASRDKEIKALGDKLEKEWMQREAASNTNGTRRLSNETKSKDGGKSKDRPRGRTRKTAAG